MRHKSRQVWAALSLAQVSGTEKIDADVYGERKLTLNHLQVESFHWKLDGELNHGLAWIESTPFWKIKVLEIDET